MCEQIVVFEVPKIGSQESVGAAKIVFQEHISERLCDQIGDIEGQCGGSHKLSLITG